jgi:(E)-4-hydroxy-3-methylbut-2-enyl-diphosphate synthase
MRVMDLLIILSCMTGVSTHMPPIPVRRRPSREVRIGDLPLGATNPIRVQSMTSTPTKDVQASLAQCIRLFEAGAEYVRLGVPDRESLAALKKIRKALHAAGFCQPLIADIHFKADLALGAVPLVEKVRINPGNYNRAWKKGKTSWTPEEVRQELDGLRSTLAPLIKTCKAHGTAIRIGTNTGSLSPRIVAQYGNTPEAMAEATMEFLRVFEELDFFSTVISLKASDPELMIRAHHAMARQMQREQMAYPMHLGVTEAGEGMEGRARSALGICSILKTGMGDTIRVSLTEAPEQEVAFAKELLSQFIYPETAYPKTSMVPQTPDRSSFEADMASTDSLKCNRRGLVIALPGPFPWEEGTYRIHHAGGGAAGTAVETAAETAGTVGEPAADKPAEKAADARDPHYLVNVFMLSKLPDPTALKSMGAGNSLVLVADTSAGFNPDWLHGLHAILLEQDIPAEILVKLRGTSQSASALTAQLASRFGDLLLGRIIGGFWLETNHREAAAEARQAAEWLLQVAGLKNIRTSYISCPTCARTAYDLPALLRQLKEELPEVVGLKIAVMGCIVNGPGEMADAHIGLLGSGNGKISIYLDGQMVKHNVEPRDAARELLDLLKQNGWLN